MYFINAGRRKRSERVAYASSGMKWDWQFPLQMNPIAFNGGERVGLGNILVANLQWERKSVRPNVCVIVNGEEGA